MATVLALHGFTRGPQHLSAFSEACLREGWNCLRPSLAPRWLPILVNSRGHLARVAERLVASGLLSGPVVVVGHSSGAAVGAWIAPILIRSDVDVRGLVFVDGNDSPNHLMEQAWPELQDLPIQAVQAPPSLCNRGGHLADLLSTRRPGSVTVIPGAGHGDIEMHRGEIYRLACGDVSEPKVWAEVQHAVLAEIANLLSLPTQSAT